MNIQQAKEEIKHTVQAYLQKDEFDQYLIDSINQRPLLLMGPPGIGKTQIMDQIAKECQIGLVAYTITHHTRQSAVGLPFIQEKTFQGQTFSTTEYTMSEIIASIYQMMEKTNKKEGILFIDEINCVSETLAPTMLQFLQCKTFGNQAIPKGWIIVAAGNPPEYNKSVREFDMVTLDRVRTLNIESDYYVWKEYALSKGIHPAIISYLELKPSCFYQVKADVDGLQFVTARGWEDLSCILYQYEALKIDIKEALFHQYLHHDDIAEDMFSYYLLYEKTQNTYDIPSILQGHPNSSLFACIVESSFDEHIALVHLVLDALGRDVTSIKQKKNILDRWFAFLKEWKTNGTTYMEQVDMEKERLNEWIHSQSLTNEQIHQNRVFIKFLRDHQTDAFDHAKADFQKEHEAFKQEQDKLLSEFDHAFQFMEDAFEKRQEMVLSVSSLTMQENTALFLSEHTVSKYEEYKTLLLVGTQRAQLLDELNH